MAESVGVAIRVRPYLSGEEEVSNQGTTADLSNEEESKVRVRIRAKKVDLRSSFGKVFPMEATQQDVFDYCETAIDGTLKGVNATVFAYGQTNSGKTHTMLGSLDTDAGPSHAQAQVEAAAAVDGGAAASAAAAAAAASASHFAVGQNAGLIPRAAHRIFQLAAADEELQLNVSCSFMQIYNNQVFDLLRDKSMRHPLRIRQRPKRGIFINGLSQVQVSSLDDILSLLRSGGARRAVRGTEYNEQSSRSHAILQLSVESQRDKQDPADEGKTRRVIHRAKLNLVDLAGSEKWNTSVRMVAAQEKELTAINSSLSALGNVISALSDEKRSHIPYRDSALTRILQDALGGNSRTVLIATVAPTLTCAEESISTLKFADRASHVKLKIRVNELLDDATLLARATREIARLKRLLKKKSTKQVKQMEDDLKLFRELNDRLRAENAQLRQQLRSLGVQFPGTPKNGNGGHEGSKQVTVIRSATANSPLAHSSRASAVLPHPLEQDRPYTTGTLLPKIDTTRIGVSGGADPAVSSQAAWETPSNADADARYATLEARIRAMEEAYRVSQESSGTEKPSDSGSDQSNSANIEEITAAVEALDDDELAVRVAAVDEDAALDLMQQQEEYKSIASEREDLENQLAALQAMLAAEHGAADDPSLAGESGPLSDTPAVALTGTSDLQAMAQAEAAAQTQIDEERRQIRLLQEQEVALDEEEKREKERLRRRQAASSASAKQRLEKIVAGLNKKKKSYGSPHDSSKASDAVSESTTLSFSVDDIGVELKVYRARFAMHYLGKVIDFDPHKESQHRIHFKKSGEKPWYNMHQHQYQIVKARPPVSLLSKKLQAAIAAAGSASSDPNGVPSSLAKASKATRKWHKSKLKIYGGGGSVAGTPSGRSGSGRSGSKSHGSPAKSPQKSKQASSSYDREDDSDDSDANDAPDISRPKANVDDDYAALFMNNS